MAFDYINYYELEYLQNSGTQYINTGISSTISTSRIETKLNYNSTDLFGSEYSGYYWGLNAVMYRTPTNRSLELTLDPGTDYTIECTWSTLKINDSVVSLIGDSNSGGGNICIFKYNGRVGTSAKFYYFKIYNGNNLVREFVPAERKSDGVYGMYDTVTENFFTNNGSGTFIAGNRLQYTITTISQPSNLGTVTTGGTYYKGTELTLTALANTGCMFNGWYDGNKDNPRSVIVTEDYTYTGLFKYIDFVDVTIMPENGGAVIQEFANDDIKLTATPATYFSFINFLKEDDLTYSSNSTYTNIVYSKDAKIYTTNPLVVNRYSKVIANFEQTYFNVELISNTDFAGTVSGAGTYADGTTVTLTATTTNTDYTFIGWFNGNTKITSSTTYSFIITEDKELEARWAHYAILC